MFLKFDQTYLCFSMNKTFKKFAINMRVLKQVAKNNSITQFFIQFEFFCIQTFLPLKYSVQSSKAIRFWNTIPGT